MPHSAAFLQKKECGGREQNCVKVPSPGLATLCPSGDCTYAHLAPGSKDGQKLHSQQDCSAPGRRMPAWCHLCSSTQQTHIVHLLVQG